MNIERDKGRKVLGSYRKSDFEHPSVTCVLRSLIPVRLENRLITTTSSSITNVLTSYKLIALIGRWAAWRSEVVALTGAMDRYG